MRSCGTCSACCRFFSVPEIKKPRKVACSHLEDCGHGCKIYALRPPSCSKFRCAWVHGHGEARDAPDTSGIMLFSRDSKYGDVLVAVDLEFGPMKPKKKALKRIARDSGMLCLLADNADPEKIVLAYAPQGLAVPRELASVGVK